MPKYQVYVTGTLNSGSELDADDPTEAFKLAEEQFKEDYPAEWTDVSATSYEVVGGEDEQDLDDGY